MHDKVPWFWSDQFDLKMVIVGLAAGHDEMIVRGDPASRAFSVCYLKAGELIAVETRQPHQGPDGGAQDDPGARRGPTRAKLADDAQRAQGRLRLHWRASDDAAPAREHLLESPPLRHPTMPP